ncbi:MAG: hypothetical protein KGI82_00870, partial [Betaproteobacteria bacterium]|nr:hypothetical protein [Betaproteobacteria bacterium]
MSNTAIWDVALSYTAQFGTSGADLDSLAAGSCAVSSTIYDNTASLYTDAWVSCSLPTLATGTGAPSLDVYLLPLNQDGTTYGDGTASGTVAPSGAYYVGSITWAASLASGTRVGSIQLPTGILNGAAGFNSGSTQVIQPVQGGVNGVDYAVTCTCPTTQSNLTL